VGYGFACKWRCRWINKLPNILLCSFHIKSPIVIRVEATNSAAQEIPNYFSINNFASVIHLRYLKDRQGS
jgi:hypothetical protein